MKQRFALSLISAIIMCTFAPARSGGTSELDLSMPMATLEWLAFVRAGHTDADIREHFMRHVAPTPGCRVIIHHWARFRKDWNAETFLDFILQALDRIPAPGPEKAADGTLTSFGRRKALWTDALRHPERLERLIQQLQNRPQMAAARARAAAALPPDTPLDNRFYLVTFGASTAFSVGSENGLDLLQLPLNADGRIDLGEVQRILAHELHHTGFFYWLNRNLPDLKIAPVMLAGILAAEGMASHFIDRVPDHLAEFRQRKNSIYEQVAADWQRHTANLPALYERSEKDMRDMLKGSLKPVDAQKWWMAGAKGPAYILGAHMIACIEKELGRRAVFVVVRDFRALLTTYNRAAHRAKLRGEHPFVFSADLAASLANHTGTGS
ncbi:MAG TPA: hypothetical protein ENN40_02665 [Candidatus Aminicenantes bacterium]|nr:hypothetical protein [Candidatus Aminicenantes bacterium]